MKLKSKIFLSILIFFSLITIYANKVNATEENEAQKYNVNIEYRIDGKPYGKQKINIYKVAEIDDNNQIKPLPEYENYNVKFDWAYDTSLSTSLANMISAIIIKDNIQPMMTVTSNDVGIARIENMDKALYLVKNEAIYTDDSIITFKPYLILLPNDNMDIIEDTDIPEIYIVAKGTIKHPDFEVIKHGIVLSWEDDGEEEERPDEIEIIIVKNDEIYDTVVLGPENDWKYEWNESNDGAEWDIILKDELMDKYNVVIEQSGDSFYLTVVKEHTDEKDKEDEKNDPIPVLDVENLKIRNPKTGEDITIYVFIVIAIVSALGLAILTYFNRKSEKK